MDDVKEQILLVLATVPNDEEGERIARTVVEERLAACCNAGLPVRSFFWWDNSVNDEPEKLLLFKTAASRLNALTARIRELHSYDVPEVIALPVIGGSEDYMHWVLEETKQQEASGGIGSYL